MEADQDGPRSFIMRSEYVRWARPGVDAKLLSIAGGDAGKDNRRPVRLARSLQNFMNAREYSFRHRFASTPMLFSYQSDGTSYLVLWRKMLGSADSHQLERKPHDLCEFLCERAWLASASGGQVVSTLALARIPRLMRDGKSASVHIAAMMKHWVHPFAQGHTSIAISFYSWDRACFSACFRLAQQHHNLCWARSGQLLFGDMWQHQKRKDVVLATPCAVHDINTGLKWSISLLLVQEERKHLFLLVEGLRKGARYLYAILEQFLTSHVDAQGAAGHDVETARAFWQAVGIDDLMLDDFAELDPVWDGNLLHVRTDFPVSSKVFERLQAMMVYPWTWRKYNSARFMVLGTGALTLLQARLLGLDRVVTMGRAGPHASSYWLHHYDCMGPEMSDYIIAVGMGAQPATALQRSVMKDCRIPMRVKELEDLIASGQHALQMLPPSLWKRLASTSLGSQSWSALKASALLVSSVSCCWFDKHVLADARKPPWSFCVGDLQANAKALRSGSAAELDEVSLQLRHLMRMGLCTEMEVASALALMQQCSWSTLEVEQSHGSLAVCHRAQPETFGSTLAMRSYLHMCRSLFTEPPEVVAEKRLRAKLDRLERTNPNMLRSTSVWYQEIAGIVNTTLGEGAHRSLGFWQGRLASASAHWNGLDAAERQRFERLAEGRRQDMWAEVHQQQEDVAAALRDLRHRQAVNKRTTPQHHLGTNRFTNADLTDLWAYFDREAESQPVTDRYMAIVAESAREIEGDEMAALGCMEHRPTGFDRRQRIQFWAEMVCANREIFSGACLMQLDPNTRHILRSWIVLCATKNPLQVFLQEVCHCMSPDMSEADRVDFMSLAPHEHWMKMVPGKWFVDTEIELDTEVDELFVLPRVDAADGAWLFSEFDLVPWYLFVKDLEIGRRGAGGAAAPAGHARAVPAWAARWLRTDTSRDTFRASAHATAPAAAAAAAPEVELTAEQEAEVDAELAEVRAWLAGVLPAHTHHFSVRVLGGRWTRRNRGRPWDAVQGFARSEMAILFCQSFGMQQSARFGRTHFVKHQGYDLAIAWAERMQFYFNMWEGQDYNEMTYSPAAAAAHDDLEFVTLILAAGQDTEFWDRGMAIHTMLPGPWSPEVWAD